MTARADILVIKLSALGDFVLAFPAFARIRAAHPNQPITLLTTPTFEKVAKASPYFDQVHTDGRPATVPAWLRLIARLRRARYARVYDLQGADRTALILQALRPFAPEWSGVAWGASLPDRDPDRMERHSLERAANQLKQAGIWPDAPTAPMSAPPPDLGWLIGEAAASPIGPPVALLVPGCAATRPLKRWPAERYGWVAQRLIEAGSDVAIVGAAQEREPAAIIRAAAPAARDLTGATDFAAIARLGARATIAIGNDTGPMHLIAAAGAPTVVLFSADSKPELSAPRGHVTVLREADLNDLSAERVLAAALASARVRH